MNENMKTFRFLLLIIATLLLLSCIVTTPHHIRPYLNKSYNLSEDMYLTETRDMGMPQYNVAPLPRNPSYWHMPSYQEYLKNPSKWYKWRHDEFNSILGKSRIVALLPKGTQFILNKYSEVNIGDELIGKSVSITIANGPYKGVKANLGHFPELNIG